MFGKLGLLTVVVLAISVFANWPRDVGSIKSNITQAGFPLVFSTWESGEVEVFDPTALSINVAIAAVVSFGVPSLVYIGSRRWQTS